MGFTFGSVYARDPLLYSSFPLVWTAAAGDMCSGVEKRCVVSPPGSTGEEMPGSQATSRKSNSSSLQEDRTPLGTGAGISRTLPPATPTRAITSKNDVLLRRSPDHAEVLANLATLLYGPKSSQLTGERVWSESAETKYIEVLCGGGSGGGGCAQCSKEAILELAAAGARPSFGRPFGKTSQLRQTTRTEEQRRESQRWRGTFRQGS